MYSINKVPRKPVLHTHPSHGETVTRVRLARARVIACATRRPHDNFHLRIVRYILGGAAAGVALIRRGRQEATVGDVRVCVHGCVSGCVPPLC